MAIPTERQNMGARVAAYGLVSALTVTLGVLAIVVAFNSRVSKVAIATLGGGGLAAIGIGGALGVKAAVLGEELEDLEDMEEYRAVAEAHYPHGRGQCG